MSKRYTHFAIHTEVGQFHSGAQIALTHGSKTISFSVMGLASPYPTMNSALTPKQARTLALELLLRADDIEGEA